MSSRQVIDTLNLKGSIESVRGGITIDGTRVPLEDVATILLGQQVSITGEALSMLARYDVVVLNCDWRGVPNLAAYGWSNNSRVAARHRGQSNLSEPRRKSAWQAIVKAKIGGQMNNLKSLNRDSWRQLERLRSQVKSGDPSNCEAQAARLYWDAAVTNPEFRRVPGATDAANSLFNYGYTIARGHMIQATCAAGLWPTLGLWHRNRSNKFCLADDLIEPFRPAVDSTVLSLDDGANLEDQTTKRILVQALSATMGKDGRTVVSAMHELATSFAIYVEGESEKLNVPTWSGPSQGT